MSRLGLVFKIFVQGSVIRFNALENRICKYNQHNTAANGKMTQAAWLISFRFNATSCNFRNAFPLLEAWIKLIELLNIYIWNHCKSLNLKCWGGLFQIFNYNFLRTLKQLRLK